MSDILSIVIPALNESGTITRVIDDANEHAKKLLRNKFEIIVADNGSTDGTLAKVNKQRIARVVNVPIRGYGAALHWGVLKSKGKYVLFADADLSYPFSNMGGFLKKIKDEPDLVLGSRIKGEIEENAMPFLNRYLGTPVLTSLIRFVYQIPTSDCNSGMRMVKKSFYQELNMRNSGMEWASELLIKTALHNGKYVEIPIVFNKDARGKKPHLSPWADGWRHLKAIVLLKPSVLNLFLYSFMILFGYFLGISFALSFLFYSLAVTLALSLVTLRLLEFTIEGRHNFFSRMLIRSPLVPITIILSLVSAIALILIPDARMGTKMFIISSLSLIYIWLFLVETIKTHLVNPLPQRI